MNFYENEIKQKDVSIRICQEHFWQTAVRNCK